MINDCVEKKLRTKFPELEQSLIDERTNFIYMFIVHIDQCQAKTHHLITLISTA